MGNVIKRRLIASIFLAIAASFYLSTPAYAHIDVSSVSPADESVVPTAPEKITLNFNSEPDPSLLKVSLFYRDGTEFPWVERDGELISFDGKSVTAYPPSLDQGTYVITYSSTGPDGHISADQFSFSVGSPSGPVGDLRTGNALWIDALQALTRWLLYIAVALTLGASVMVMMAKRGRPMRRNPSSVVKLGVILIVIGSVLRFASVVVAVAVTSGLSYVHTIVTNWKGALAWSLLLVSITFFLIRRPWAIIAGTVIFTVAETMTGHLMYIDPSYILVPLGALHLLGVIAWFGIPAAAIATVEIDRSAWYKVLGVIFWPLAIFAPVVALTGPALFWVRTGGFNEMIGSLGGLYGQIVGLKTILLGAITFVAIGHLIRRRYLADNTAKVLTDQPEIKEEILTLENNDKGDVLSGIRRSLRRETALLAIVALLGVSLAGTLPLVSNNSNDLLAAPASYEQCEKEENEADRFLCASRYFENVAETQSVAIAIKDFSSRWSGNDIWIQSNCHQLGHRLGRFGWLKYKDILTAFSQGSDPCDYGYMHGVIEGASAQFDEDELKASMATMCEVIPGSIGEHMYRQCIHGLGHAAARRVNNDMPRAVEFCRGYYKDVKRPLSQSDSNWYRFHLCVTGISMEWNLSSKAYGTSTFEIGEEGTMLYECGQLEEIFQAGCIEYATTPYGGQLTKLAQVRDWCDENLEEPLPCYWSIGRDALVPWVTFKDASEVCLEGKNFYNMEQCINRMAGNIATRALDAESIVPFCAILPDAYKPICELSRQSMAVMLEQMKRGLIVKENKDGSVTAELTTPAGNEPSGARE